MTEKIKTFAIIFLASLSVVMGALSYYNQRFIDDLIDDAKRNLKYDDTSQFGTAYSAIKEINQNEITEAAYLLYTVADMRASRLEDEEISPCTSEDLKEFKRMYREFMQTQCALDHFKSCLSYGHLLEKDGNYDAAYSAFIKSAENGDLSAMAALADLYRNRSWSKSSEEKAKEWLVRVGKQ